MKDCLISVIIPTYNRMNTLPRAVDSVLCQTYQNLELIIVDDGSTDNTKEYIDSLTDKRIHYYRNTENLGAAGSRNVGASLAKGEYLAFQDSDDEWLPNKLEDVLECLGQEGNQDADLIFHQMEEDYHGNRQIISDIRASDLKGGLYPYILCFPLVSPQATLIQKTAFLELGGFCEVCKSFEDYELSLRFAKNKKVVYFPKVLTILYDSPDGINKNFTAKIDTELYVIKTFFSDYQKFDLLQKKIELVHKQAVNYDCEAYFYEKVMDVCEELTDEAAKELMQAVIVVSDSQCGAASDKSEYFREAVGMLEHIADSLKKLNANARQSPQLLIKNFLSVKGALEDVLCDVTEYCDLTEHPMIQKNKMEVIAQNLAVADKSPGLIMNVLEQLIAETESVLEQIGKERFICGRCGHEVRMLPMSPYRSILRRRLGFFDGTICFLFENEHADICPACGADTMQRFLLTFLDDIRPENDEKLRITIFDDTDNGYVPDCQVGAAEFDRLKDVIKGYAAARDYVIYSDDAEKDGADILICFDLLERSTEPICRLKKMRDITKNTGVVIILVPAVKSVADNRECHLQEMDLYTSIRFFGMENVCRIYSEDELMQMFTDSGFCCTVIDQGWFGEELYNQMAFSQNAKLFMLEKNLS